MIRVCKATARRRNRLLKLSTIAAICLNLTFVTACGVSSQKSPKQIAFANVTKEQVIRPDAKVDPSVVKGTDYTHVKVINSAGKTVTLDARQHPILFVAYWCPHCQRTLINLSKNRSKFAQLPILVSLGFPSNVSLATAVKVEHSEEQQLHLASFQVYYALSPSAGNTYAPKGYPTLAYFNSSKRHLMTLFGEHTLSVWEQVLNGVPATSISLLQNS